MIFNYLAPAATSSKRYFFALCLLPCFAACSGGTSTSSGPNISSDSLSSTPVSSQSSLAVISSSTILSSMGQSSSTTIPSSSSSEIAQSSSAASSSSTATDPRQNWVLNASHNTEELSLAIDESVSTRWTTKSTQHNGQWLSIDLGSVQTFNRIHLNVTGSANDFGQGYLVYASNNQNNWGSPLTLINNAQGNDTLTLPETTARHIKIVQTGLSDRYWWSIHDISISLADIPPIEKEWNISSLAQLRNALAGSDQTLIMKPGYYDLTTLESDARRFLLTGSNNTIDLRGVYIEVPVGSTTRESYFVIEGSNNVITGGEFEDTYPNGFMTVTDFISYNEDSSLSYGLKGQPVITVLGNGNLIDGIKLTIRGSFPYGYGSLFGIGAGSSFGLSKRCGIVVKGDGNSIENTQLIQRAFCHGIYLQSPADNTTVRNTYVEGAVRASNDMLAEGEGSLPLRNSYLDVDGNPIAANEMHSLSEDGIRVYNGGGSVIVENCTVKKMRGGIRLYLASGASVSNSIAIDNGNTNYNLPKSAIVTGSVANFTYAPVSDFRLSRSYQNLDLTIQASPNAVGAHNIADILGGNHTIIFRRAPGPEDTQETRSFIVYGNNSTIRNETEYKIILLEGTSGNTIISAGEVTDLGDNIVSSIPLILN